MKKGMKVMAKQRAIVISAFPACGKTFFCRHLCSPYTAIDSDSSKFSWAPVFGKPEKMERNPDFPANYIEHIKENIGKVDFIFVSSHLEVRQALEDAGIDYYTIYPDLNLRNEWVGRLYLRGDNDGMIRFIADNFSKFVGGVVMEPHGREVIRLKAGEYISLPLLKTIRYYFEREMK